MERFRDRMQRREREILAEKNADVRRIKEGIKNPVKVYKDMKR